MPKRAPSVLLKKVSNFVKIPSISLNLILLKKNSGKAKFYRHNNYNHGFIQEYQFSPSNSPLHIRKQYYLRKEKMSKKLQSIFLFMCMCLGDYGVEEKEEAIYSSQKSSLMEIMPPLPPSIKNELDMLEIDDDECRLLTVDERAERFIEKFYAQMRMQCQDSNHHLSLLLCD